MYNMLKSVAKYGSYCYFERHLDSTAITFFLGFFVLFVFFFFFFWGGAWGNIFDNNFVLYGSIFFILVPNESYLHGLSVDLDMLTYMAPSRCRRTNNHN